MTRKEEKELHSKPEWMVLNRIAMARFCVWHNQLDCMYSLEGFFENYQKLLAYLKEACDILKKYGVKIEKGTIISFSEGSFDLYEEIEKICNETNGLLSLNPLNDYEFFKNQEQIYYRRAINTEYKWLRFNEIDGPGPEYYITAPKQVKQMIRERIESFHRTMNKCKKYLDKENRQFAESVYKELVFLLNAQETTKKEDNNIDKMTGIEFEYWCAKVLKNNAFNSVQITKASGDQGVDIIAEKDGIKYAVQCKCYSKDLGNTPVQEVSSGKTYYGCHIGVVMTNRFFTQGAKELADSVGVLLWDRDKVLSMAGIVDDREKLDLINQIYSRFDRNKHDELFAEAVLDCWKLGTMTKSVLNIKYQIGSKRAEHLMEELIEEGIISRQNGLELGKILINRENIINEKANISNN